MLIILYSSLLSYMLFFTFCIAPVINTQLDRKNSSLLLRKIFPRNFIFGSLLSLVLILFSFLYENLLSKILSSVIFIFYLLNLYYLMPKINKEADSDIIHKKYSRKFKRLHLYSVLLYLLQIILALTAIIIIY